MPSARPRVLTCCPPFPPERHLASIEWAPDEDRYVPYVPAAPETGVAPVAPAAGAALVARTSRGAGDIVDAVASSDAQYYTVGEDRAAAEELPAQQQQQEEMAGEEEEEEEGEIEEFQEEGSSGRTVVPSAAVSGSMDDLLECQVVAEHRPVDAAAAAGTSPASRDGAETPADRQQQLFM